MQILGLDVGTSSVKAAVLDATTEQHLGPIFHVPCQLRHPTPDAAELDPEEIWQTVTRAARQACRDFPDVQGVGLSVLTPGLVLLDKADQPLGPIWTHLDRRARPAARQVWAAVGQEFLATAGNRPLPGGISAVCYRQQLVNDPYLCHGVRSYLHINGWLALRLTGERAFDSGNASVSGLFSTMADRQWSKRWCDYFEVDHDWLPSVMAGNATVGCVRAAVAAECGLTAGIPVKLGMPDTSCAMLAAGVTEDDLMHIVGTTQLLARLVQKPTPSPRMLTRLLGLGDTYIQVVHNPVGGIALDWMHQLCFRDQSTEEFFNRTIPSASLHPTRVLLDPPFLGGDRLEIDAHRAAFRDLTLAADRLDLLAAVVQALVKCQREALALMDRGRPWKRILLTGGGAETVRRLVPEYATAKLEMVEEGSLRGVARLFHQ
jgi:xylulokinase